MNRAYGSGLSFPWKAQVSVRIWRSQSVGKKSHSWVHRDMTQQEDQIGIKTQINWQILRSPF